MKEPSHDNPKSVIVSGGSGFIGKPLCRALMAGGYRVTVLTRGASRPLSADPEGALPEYVTWDGHSGAGWGHLADGAHALVNLAGEGIAEGRWTPERKSRILQSRVHAGQAMLAAVAQAAVKPRVFIQGSGVGYYGDTGDEAVDESSPPGSGFLTDVCLEWEASTRAVEDLGVRWVVLRMGLVMGRGGGVLQKMLTPFRLFVGGPLGEGNQGIPWIHMEDAVRAIVFLLENEAAAGPYNLTAPEAVSNLDFCRYLGRAMSRPCGLAVPAAALRLAMGELADELLLSGCRAFPKRLVELGFEFRHPRLAEALKELMA
ncbi:TIGR01777 family oxidoreductase [Fundidesulfovibrio terrae]|uniref:TIGR01777 family oxidoreductase n=1 Tax=Fundidesulfovibrio terrae TaxID=2922866 RepID=UPI001FB0493A|nr:TIGR01777 family oxidoreductase [Fundidesulfovibrio terrae]